MIDESSPQALPPLAGIVLRKDPSRRAAPDGGLFRGLALLALLASLAPVLIVAIALWPTGEPSIDGATTPPWAGTALGLLVALLLGGALASRLTRSGSLLTSATHRARALAAGRAGAAPLDVPREVAVLHGALDECAAALGDGRLRADAEQARRQRFAEVAATLDRACERTSERVPRDLEDEPATDAVVVAANRLLESFEARLLRWKSNVEVISEAPTDKRAAAVRERVRALAGVPLLLSNVAQRLVRVARVPDLPPKATDELVALGEALAARARTAQSLVDQLLTDATDPPGGAPAALAALRQELGALSSLTPAHTTVAALRDLPVELSTAELAHRVSLLAKP